MSKQIYIDSNGNEIQVSGTVNSADMMPMSGNDSTKVSEAIGDLSTLTTTDKSSLVGAVNSQGVASAITPTSTKGTFSACFQSVVGDMVIVQGVFACTTTSNAGDVLFVLPYPMRNNTSSSAMVMFDATSSSIVHARMTSSGDTIAISTFSTGHSYRFTFAYIK